MMKNTIITSILAIGFTTALAIAAGTPVPYIFQGGDPASATQVNANFQDLADRIETVSSSDVYDFHNYLTDSNIVSKEFNAIGKCGEAETHTFSRVGVADGTKVTLTREVTIFGTKCQHMEDDFLNTATEGQWLENRGYEPSSGTLGGTLTIDDPVAVATSTMKINSSWADASTTTTTVPASPPVSGGIINMQTLAGVEDVTVPYNGGTTYTDCLKLYRNRQLGVSGHHTAVEWHCPVVGYVKSILINTNNGNLVIRELSNIQY